MPLGFETMSSPKQPPERPLTRLEFLRELATALDAMELRELGSGALFRVSAHPGKPQCCALGAWVLWRFGSVVSWEAFRKEILDDGHYIIPQDLVGRQASKEVYSENDGWSERPAERWIRMRNWVRQELEKGEDQ